MKKYDTGRTFYRYFLSYITILFLAIILVWIISLQYISKTFGSSIAQNTYRSLKQSNVNIEDMVRQMFNICYLTQTESQLQHINSDSGVTDRMTASSVLARYASVCSFAERILYYTENQKHIYMSSESITPELFFGRQYVYDHHTVDDFHDAISLENGLVVWGLETVTIPVNKTGRYLTVFVSVFNSPAIYQTKLIFLIPEKNIKSFFSSVTQGTGTSVFLFDQEMNPIYVLDEKTDLVHMVSTLKSISGGEMQRYTIDGEDYYIWGVRSSVTGWTLAAAIPVSIAESGLTRQRNITSLAMISILIAGSISAFFLSRYNYKPIRLLIHATVPCAKMTVHDDEMNVIADEIYRLSLQNEKLHRRMKLQLAADRNDFCGKLLHGCECTDTLRKQAQEYSISLDSRYYYVAAFVVKPAVSTQLSVNALNTLNTQILSFFTEYPQVLLYRSNPDPRRMALILSLNEPEPIETSFLLLRDHLETAFNINIAIGISICCQSVSDLGEAYRQSCQALDERIVYGSSSVYLYNDQEVLDNILQHYPSKELEKLQWNLLQLDANNTTMLITEIITLLREKHMSVSGVRMICYDIANTIMKCFSNLAVDSSFKLPSETLEEIVSFNTVEELLSLLTCLINDTCKAIQHMNHEQKKKRIHTLIQYIEDHYHLENFSINMMADHFNISLSNLSHYFKTHTDQTISEYVQEIRFTESCRMLKETDDSIQVICSKIGMLNVSSYIRRFKQIYGITPGSYRESAQKLS